MSHYQFREVMISERPSQSNPAETVFIAVGVSKSKKDKTVTQEQTEDQFKTAEEALNFAKDYLRGTKSTLVLPKNAQLS